MKLKKQTQSFCQVYSVKVLEIKLQCVLNFTCAACSGRKPEIAVVCLVRRQRNAGRISNCRNRVVRRAASRVSAGNKSAVERAVDIIAPELRRVERIEHFETQLDA